MAMEADGLTAPDYSHLYRHSASEIIPLIKSGVITAERYARSLLARIHERDEHVQAWAYLDVENVIRQAKLLDEIPKDHRGPLHGVPVAVKDVINTKG